MAFGFRDDATRLLTFPLPGPRPYPTKAYCLINKLAVTLSLLFYLFLSPYLCLPVSHKLINAAFYSDLRFVYCQPLRPDDGDSGRGYDFGSGFGLGLGIYMTLLVRFETRNAHLSFSTARNNHSLFIIEKVTFHYRLAGRLC